MIRKFTSIALILSLLLIAVASASCEDKNNDDIGTGEVTGTDTTKADDDTTKADDDTTKADDDTTKADDDTTEAIDNSETEIRVMTQEYIGDNIAEILMIGYDGSQPAFEEYNWKNPEIEMINNIIEAELQYMYNDFMDNRGEDWIVIKSYPFTSEDYVQIVTTYATYPSYGMDGNIKSYNFSKKENRYISVEDIMKELEITNEILAQKAKELYIPDSLSMYMGEVKAKGFLIRQYPDQTYTLLLLEATIENSESDPWITFFSYIVESDELMHLSSHCLFDPYDMDEMNPPLSYMRDSE